jgi:ribonuclease-3
VEQQTLQKCQDRIGYHFDDPTLLSLALTHSSVAPTRAESNERLEFLGDAILGMVICEDLFRHADELHEGEMTKIKSSVVSRRTCSEVADEIGITELLHLGRGLGEPANLPTSISAAVLEAVIGAIYLDGGLNAAREFTLDALRPHVDAALETEHQQNFKSALQQYAQKTWDATPEYLLLDEKGPDHAKCFEVAVTIRGRHFPSAWGMSKKDAEQQAALRTLQELGIVKLDKPDA